MNKIWYRNPSKSEVIGRCGGDDKKRMTDKSQTLIVFSPGQNTAVRKCYDIYRSKTEHQDMYCFIAK